MIGVILSACSSPILIYDKNIEDKEKIELIKKIIKNPSKISCICREDTQITELFKKVICNSDMEEGIIDFIKQNFKGTNTITINEKEKNVHYFRIENEISKEYVYFTFRIEKDKWLLNIIHGKIEM